MWSKSQIKYAQSSKGKIARKKYQESSKGIESHKRYMAKRKAKLAEAKQAKAATLAKPVKGNTESGKIKAGAAVSKS